MVIAIDARPVAEEIHMTTPNRGTSDANRRPPHPSPRRLARLLTAASTRPWAVLWAPVPVTWELSARAARRQPAGGGPGVPAHAALPGRHSVRRRPVRLDAVAYRDDTQHMNGLDHL